MATVGEAMSGPTQDPQSSPPTPPLGPQNPFDAAEAVQPALTFWQLPWVQNLLPLITSIAIHLGIIILGLLAYGAVHQITKQLKQEQVIVPDASFTDGPVGGIPNPGLGGD